MPSQAHTVPLQSFVSSLYTSVPLLAVCCHRATPSHTHAHIATRIAVHLGVNTNTHTRLCMYTFLPTGKEGFVVQFQLTFIDILDTYTCSQDSVIVYDGLCEDRELVRLCGSSSEGTMHDSNKNAVSIPSALYTTSVDDVVVRWTMGEFESGSGFTFTYSFVCKEGYQPYSNNNGCYECPADTFKDTVGGEACTPCPTGSTTDGATGQTGCTCSRGYYSSSGSVPCSICDGRSFQPFVGSSECIVCTKSNGDTFECLGTSEASGRDEASDCDIRPGCTGSWSNGDGWGQLCWSSAYSATYGSSSCTSHSNSINGASAGTGMTANIDLDDSIGFEPATLTIVTTAPNFKRAVLLRAGYASDRVAVTFSSFEFQDSPGCTDDVMTLYDGDSYTNPTLARLCGSGSAGSMHDLAGNVYPLGSTFISSGNAMILVYTGNYDYDLPSFRLEYQRACPSGQYYLDGSCSTCPNKERPFTASSGEEPACFADTSKAVSHSSSGATYTGWVIEVSSDKVVELTFSSFSLDDSSECSTDGVSIYSGDGNEQSALLLHRLCGSGSSSHDETGQVYRPGSLFYSSTYIMSLALQSNGGSHGFAFSYAAVCNRGFAVQGGSCKECVVGTYNDVPGSGCTSCPADSSTLDAGSISPEQCLCDDGYYMDSVLFQCAPCTADTYSEEAGVRDGCTPCPTNSGTGGSTGGNTIQDCSCKRGTALDGGLCVACPSGKLHACSLVCSHFGAHACVCVHTLCMLCMRVFVVVFFPFDRVLSGVCYFLPTRVGSACDMYYLKAHARTSMHASLNNNTCLRVDEYQPYEGQTFCYGGAWSPSGLETGIDHAFTGQTIAKTDWGASLDRLDSYR